MIKMVISDMDGTLLNSDLEISPQNLQAIEGLRQKGIRFCIATGRPEQFVKAYIDPLHMTDPMILNNGSVIGHPFQDETLYELILDDNDVRAIVEYCEANDVIYLVYAKDKIMSKPNFRMTFFKERNKQLPEKYRAVCVGIPDINKMIIENDINKILLVETNPIKYKKVKAFISGYPQFSVVSSESEFIDIMPLTTSKGNALKILADHFGYTLDEIVAFGDQDNDESMLAAAGIGVAMANASDLAQSAADETTLSNDKNGVAEWINHNLL